MPAEFVHVVSSLSRMSGGIGPVVRSLAEGQAQMGHSVHIFCLKDEFTAGDCADARVRISAAERRKQGTFGWSRTLRPALLAHATGLVHSHGIWMHPGIVARQVARKKGIPLVVSPHGMLDSWAWRISPLKKQAAMVLYERKNLRTAACIHALCESEYRSIRACGLNNPVCVIPNGVDVPAGAAQRRPPWEPVMAAEEKVVLFLGRVHPKKGLENVVRAWHRLRTQEAALLDRWHLVIAGWSQLGHVDRLRELALRLARQEDIMFLGPLYGDDKAAALQHAQAFLLPSFSEGLPLAVLEAWAHGLPVVMTEECNLPEGFAAGAAIRVRPVAESVAAGLKELLSLPEKERVAMGRRGRAIVMSRFTWPKIAAQMVEVYRWVAGTGPPPPCVRLD
jgi:glycosyltransferase involved in cell wall biosynthesis